MPNNSSVLSSRFVRSTLIRHRSTIHQKEEQQSLGFWRALVISLVFAGSWRAVWGKFLFLFSSFFGPLYLIIIIAKPFRQASDERAKESAFNLNISAVVRFTPAADTAHKHTLVTLVWLQCGGLLRSAANDGANGTNQRTAFFTSSMITYWLRASNALHINTAAVQQKTTTIGRLISFYFHESLVVIFFLLTILVNSSLLGFT